MGLQPCVGRLQFYEQPNERWRPPYLLFFFPNQYGTPQSNRAQNAVCTDRRQWAIKWLFTGGVLPQQEIKVVNENCFLMTCHRKIISHKDTKCGFLKKIKVNN